MNYELVRSSRKTLAIHIANAKIIVKAPLKMPQKYIDDFVDTKKDWINQHLAISASKKTQKDNFVLNFGDSILFLGKPYQIIAKKSNKIGFDGANFFAPDSFDDEQIKKACVKIYKALAKQHILQRVDELSKKMGLCFNSIKITSAVTRWGSCSTKGNINFSWRLVMADEATIDYVVVHELAHLKIMNHSKKFWDIIKNVFPDYQKSRAKLKALGKKLSLENWG